MIAQKDEKLPQDQKLARCYSTYERARKKNKSKGSNEEPNWDDFEGKDAIIFL